MTIKIKQQDFVEDVKLCFKGFCMGGANVIPGVSGGTIAFLFGIYEELINAIKKFDLQLVRYLCSFQFKKAFEYIPCRFLGALGGGVLLAIAILCPFLKWAFQYHPVLLNAFFFGLILATAPIIARILKWTPKLILLGVVVTIGMYGFVGMVPVSTPDAAWFIFLCGALAIATMILPGISGSFVLLLLGKYHYIVEAVNDLNLFVLGVFAVGCVFGILLFVRLLSWLLTRYHDITVVVLTGLIIGSLRKVWPWKATLRTITTVKGKVVPIEQVNILPHQINFEFGLAVALCLLGFAMAFSLSSTTPKKLVQ
ncbi:MAG: DUF368 domain-containing protein [Candidatus Omnitrophica bacterium]|nr:DUF368 domain-containing protein [Candidatus Omnitrophota bacterium]